MTIEAYIEMCEIMGDEIDPSMLVGLEDFPHPIIVATQVYNYLPDEYLSGMEGATYLGKNLIAAPDLLKFHDIVENEDVLLSLWALKAMNDRVRKKSFAKAKAKSSSHSKPQST